VLALLLLRAGINRNSKLTFRLQDALGGGNSKLLVVACISTAANDLQETKETLRFAEMARAITNSPVVNREPKDELIHRLQEQVAELQDQVKAARKEGGRAATEEVLAQLNATEAALADLKEEMVRVCLCVCGGGPVSTTCFCTRTGWVEGGRP
jgi:hypothetical protein